MKSTVLWGRLGTGPASTLFRLNGQMICERHMACAELHLDPQQIPIPALGLYQAWPVRGLSVEASGKLWQSFSTSVVFGSACCSNSDIIFKLKR